MTRPLTDDDLDGALRDLGAVVDHDTDAAADRARLAAARGRLVASVADPHLDEAAEVLEIAPRGLEVRRPRGRVAAAVLAVAALAAGLALAVVLWPRAGGSTAPLGPGASADPTVPRVPSSQQWLARDLGLLPRPLPPSADSQVLFETSGRGDALFGDAFRVVAPVDGDFGSLVVDYSFVCGDPTPDPAAGVPTILVTDDGGTASGIQPCATLGSGRAQIVSFGPPTVADRHGIRVQTSDPDVVWRLVVSIGPR